MVYIIYIIGIVVVGFIGFLIVNSLYVGITTAPFCATPKQLIREALDKVQLKPKERFYDLGAGDGRTLLIANREFGAEAYGIELSLFRFLVVKAKIALFAHGKKDIKIHWGDLYKQNLFDADVIFVWLTPPAHLRLEEKFTKEFKAGVRIVTYSSPLGFWKPDFVLQPSPKKGKIFLYIKPR